MRIDVFSNFSLLSSLNYFAGSGSKSVLKNVS